MNEEFNPEARQGVEGTLWDVIKAFFASKLNRQQTLRLAILLVLVCAVIFIICLRNVATYFEWI